MYHHIGESVSTYEFERDTNIQSIARIYSPCGHLGNFIKVFFHRISEILHMNTSSQPEKLNQESAKRLSSK
jgi:hypothetical protein